MAADSGSAPQEDSGRKAGKRIWRTGLLLTTSAALGGIALAIWNRRSLARIREGTGHSDAAQDQDGQPDDSSI